jgi:hypothetical protein
MVGSLEDSFCLTCTDEVPITLALTDKLLVALLEDIKL